MKTTDMGLINCPKHGYSGIAINIQKEICEKMYSNQELFEMDLTVIQTELYDEDEFLLDVNYILFKETKNILNLDDYYKISTDADEKLLEPLNKSMGAICVKCFDAYKYRNNIQSIIDKYYAHGNAD